MADPTTLRQRINTAVMATLDREFVGARTALVRVTLAMTDALEAIVREHAADLARDALVEVRRGEATPEQRQIIEQAITRITARQQEET
jgi:hypothetical protein